MATIKKIKLMDGDHCKWVMRDDPDDRSWECVSDDKCKTGCTVFKVEGEDDDTVIWTCECKVGGKKNVVIVFDSSFYEDCKWVNNKPKDGDIRTFECQTSGKNCKSCVIEAEDPFKNKEEGILVYVYKCKCNSK